VKPSKAQWLLRVCVPHILTPKDTAFCSECNCYFLRFSEDTAVISEICRFSKHFTHPTTVKRIFWNLKCGETCLYPSKINGKSNGIQLLWSYRTEFFTFQFKFPVALCLRNHSFNNIFLYAFSKTILLRTVMYHLLTTMTIRN